VDKYVTDIYEEKSGHLIFAADVDAVAVVVAVNVVTAVAIAVAAVVAVAAARILPIFFLQNFLKNL